MLTMPIVLLASFLAAGSPDTSPVLSHVVFPGRVYLAVEVAVKELRRRSLEVDPTEIEVIETTSAIHVLFQHPKRSSSQPGQSWTPAGLEVTLDRTTLNITSAQYSK